jgi:hypothetical protein
VQEATEAQITQLGYSLPLPDDAKNAAYSTVDSGAALPIAQVTFQSGGQKYTCRALKTESSKDISGISADWAQTLSWKAGTLEMQNERIRRRQRLMASAGTPPMTELSGVSAHKSADALSVAEHGAADSGYAGLRDGGGAGGRKGRFIQRHAPGRTDSGGDLVYSGRREICLSHRIHIQRGR